MRRLLLRVLDRPARKAVRKILDLLRTAPDAEWENIIVTTVAAEPSIYPYVKRVKVCGALTEAGADDAFVQRFLKHPICDLIPPDLL